jgi:GT2 family glycosyltransferase/tetratricopeptide (TPR) repeat protein
MSLSVEFDSFVRRADRLRDSGQVPEAAEYYGKATRLNPRRADIWVQLGNMLKDSREYARAEAAYRAALSLDDKADTHLQLGHLFKMLGDRNRAQQAYQRATELAPGNSTAVHELAEMGATKEQERRALGNLRDGALEILWSLNKQIDALRTDINRISRMLPDSIGRCSFPVSMYDIFREIYSIPAPPERRPVPIHIVIAAERESPETLFRQMEGICAQAVCDWTLSVFGHDPERRKTVELIAVANPRIRWIEVSDIDSMAATEMHIASAAGEEWLLLLASGAVLDPQALAWFACAQAWSDADAFVCDEETGIVNRGQIHRSAPILRQVPDFDTLLEANVFGETIAVRSTTYRAFAGKLPNTSITANRTALLLALLAGRGVGHVPHPLVWRNASDAANPREHLDGVNAYLQEAGLAGRVERVPYSGPRWHSRKPDAQIAVIIPTRDNASDLINMVDSLRRTAITPEAIEILVVDNGTRREQDLQTLSDLARQDNVHLLRFDQPFNWSHLNNQAAAETDAPVLVFANDDMEMRSTGWDVILRGLLEREEIGAVGARLLYEDGTIQHAGVLFGWRGGVIHDGLLAGGEKAGPAERWRVTRSVSAVTGAFLTTRRTDFIAERGFDALSLPVAYSDIDYCLKVRSRGKRILWTPAITLLHYESKTRGLDHTDRWRAVRNEHEQEIMLARWGAALECDPSVHPYWWPAALPFDLLAPVALGRIREHIQLTGLRHPWNVDRS